MRSLSLRHIPIWTLAVLSLYFSYSENFFRAANPTWFATFQLDSEQLVLDGLLRGGEDVRLGRYSRPSEFDQWRRAHQLYQARDTSGEFKPYRSQYGLQVKAFQLLAKAFEPEVKTLKSISAFLMSVVLTALLYCIARDFSIWSAAAVFAVLSTSPWLIAFSSNLYWVPFTWFLPLTLMWLIAPKLYDNNRYVLVMIPLALLTVLLKALCGYEYLSAIIIAMALPVIFHGVRQAQQIRAIVLRLAAILMISIVAFLIAIQLHANATLDDPIGGYERVLLTAAKRLSSDDPAAVAKATCNGNLDCEQKITKSLSANRAIVFLRYFYNDKLIPWINAVNFEPSEVTNIRSALAKARAERALSPVLNLDADTLKKGIQIGLLNAAGFSFLASLMVGAVRLRSRMPTHYNLVIATAFIGSVSWFLIAKGHSYDHFHLNYVLWYLFFIPFSIIYLVEFLRLRTTS